MAAQQNPALMWRLLLLAAVAVAVAVAAVVWILDAGQWLSLAHLKSRHASLVAQVAAQPFLAAALFFALYATVAALCVPGTPLLTLAAGTLFGLVPGVLIVSFSSALGATLAFLMSRFLLRDWVQRRFATQLAAINRGIERDGAFYLIFLGLTPVFPYFLINLVMGITPMRVTTFYWASQAGMLIETILVVNAGTELAKVDSLAGLLSPPLLVSLALIGLVPLVLRWVLTHEKMPARWRRTIDKQP